MTMQYVGWNGYDMRDNSEVDWSAYGTYTTTLLSEKAEAVIKAHDPEKPFFLYMSHLAGGGKRWKIGGKRKEKEENKGEIFPQVQFGMKRELFAPELVL